MDEGQERSKTTAKSGIIGTDGKSEETDSTAKFWHFFIVLMILIVITSICCAFFILEDPEQNGVSPSNSNVAVSPQHRNSGVSENGTVRNAQNRHSEPFQFDLDDDDTSRREQQQKQRLERARSTRDRMSQFDHFDGDDGGMKTF